MFQIILSAVLFLLQSQPTKLPNISGLDFGVPSVYTEKCDMAIVNWVDASIHVKTGGIDLAKANEPEPYVSSFGCTAQTEDFIYVIHSFVDGKPDDYLKIPKAWTMDIKRLSLSEESVPEKPEKN